MIGKARLLAGGPDEGATAYADASRLPVQAVGQRPARGGFNRDCATGPGAFAFNF